MENRAHAIVAVSFLIVLSIGAVLVFYWLSSGPETPRVYRIVTRESVAGLGPQSRVMFKGLQVGRIDDIRFDPQDHSHVIMDFRVQRDAYITQATYAVVAAKGLIGNKVLQLKIGDGSREPLPTNAENPAHIPLRKGLIAQLEQAARENLQELHTLLASVNAILNTENRGHVSAILQQLDTLTAQLITLEEQLAPAVGQLPQLVTDMTEALEQTQALLGNVNKLAEQARVPLGKAAELEETIQHLSHSLDSQTLPDIGQLTQSLTQTSRMLQELILDLQTNPQSLIFGAPEPVPGPGEPGFGDKGR